MNGRHTPIAVLTIALMALGAPSPVTAAAVPTELDGAPITVTVTLTGADSAQAYAAAVSTPGHPDYRRTLNRAQLRSRFGAGERTVARVSTAARRAGFTVTGLDATGTRLTLVASAATVQAALGVTVHRATRHGAAVRTAAPTRAPWAAGDVQAITGIVRYAARPLHTGRQPAGIAARGRGPSATTAAAQACARYWGEVNNATVPQKYPPGRQSNQLCGYTGAQLRALYGLGTADTGAGQSIVIVGAYNDPNVLADANATFAVTGVTPLPASRYTVKTYASAAEPGVECDTDAWNLEQALDVQAAHAMAPAARIVYVPASDCTQLEETVAAVIADASLDATVVSNSWGIVGEPDDPGYLAATNSTLSRAAILGIGTYFASGDFGDNSDLPDAPGRASVVFPASSPWTTAVGGTTTAIGASNQTLFQTGWADAGNTLTDGQWRRLDPAFVGGAGGGTSTSFTKPTWQTTVPGTRRAVPDLAALADPFTGLAVGTSTGGQLHIGPIGGTSLATPIVASLIALAQARAGGDTTVGFLAPLLYANSAAGATTTADVRPVAAGIYTPQVRAQDPPGDYLVDVNATPQSLTTTPGYDRLTGVGAPGRSFLTDVVS